MDHRFNVDMAVKYGLPEALLIAYIHHWMYVNRAANRTDHFIDGRWWTYGTIRQMAEVFPYFSEYALQRILTKLIKAEIVLSGRFNRSNINQTRWYSLNDEVTKYLDAIEYAKSQNGASPNMRNRKIEDAKSQNGICEIAESHNTVNITTVNKTTVISSNAREAPQPAPEREHAEITQAFRNFEHRFGTITKGIVERIAVLLEEYGDDIYDRAWEKLKGAKPPVTSANRGIRYLETTCMGLAAGNDYSKAKKNDVVAAARKVEEALAREATNDDTGNTSDPIWSIWQG